MSNINEIIGHISAMRAGKPQISATSLPDDAVEAEVKDVGCVSMPHQDNVVLAFEGDDIEKLLLSIGVLADKNNVEIAEALLKVDAEITPENITKVAELKRMVEYITSELSEDVLPLLAYDELPADISALCEIISMKKNEVSDDENLFLLRREPDEKIVEKDLFEIYGNRQIEKTRREIAMELASAGIPVVKRNIEKVEAVLDNLSKLKLVNDEAIAVCIKKESAFSIDSLYRAALYVAGKYSHPHSVSQEDLKLVEQDIKKLLAASGHDASEESVNIAKAIIKTGAGLSKATIDAAKSVKEDIRIIQENCNAQTALLLARKNIDTEKEEVSSLARVITQHIKTKEQVCSIYQNQSESYISSNILNESTEKLEKSIAVFLKANDLTTDAENISICKALIKNGINVSKKAVQDFKLLLENENIRSISKYCSHRVIINGKAADVKELVKIAEKLDNTAKEMLKQYGKDSMRFLNAKNISDKVSEVLDANMKAICLIMKCNLRPTERNVKIAGSFAKNGAGMDFRLEPVSFEYVPVFESVSLEDNETEGLKQELRQGRGLLEYAVALKSMKTFHAALAAKYEDMQGIKNFNIRNLAAIMSGSSNKLSLSSIINNIEHMARHDKYGDVNIKRELNELLEHIKNELPRVDLANIKEQGIIEFSSMMKEKIKYIRQKLETMQSGMNNSNSFISSAISQAVKDLQDISSLYSYAQKDCFFVQVPFILNGRLSNLNLFINKRKGRSSMKQGEEPYCISMNLETNTLGILDISLEIKGKSVKAYVKVERDSFKQYFIKMSQQLHKKIAEGGFSLDKFSCTSMQEDAHNDAADKIKEKTVETAERYKGASAFRKKANAGGGFEARI